MLDTEGYLSEGSGENLFIVRDGAVKTTPLTSILNGITRNAIITYLRNAGIPVEEQRFTRDELYCADEVFMTGTAAEISPVLEVDWRKIGNGKMGPITKKVQTDYMALVTGERIPEYAKGWLTPIQ